MLVQVLVHHIGNSSAGTGSIGSSSTSMGTGTPYTVGGSSTGTGKPCRGQ